MITDLELVKMSTTSSADTWVTEPSAFLATFFAPPLPSPKPPMSTLAMLRFMALHMTMVRITPLHPTKAPETTKALLESMKPAAEVEKPDKLKRSGSGSDAGRTQPSTEQEK